MSKCFVWLATAAAIAPAAPALAQAPPTRPSAQSPAKPAPKEVEGVTVTGQSTAAPVATSIDRRTYNVGKDLQATTGSIGDALRNIPSVQVDVQGNLSLRGDPNVTIMIDGKPSGLFRGEGRGAALQQIPADRIERVEVITNPSAEFRAEGTGGVINLITKKAQGAGRTGSVRVNLGSSERANAGLSAGYNSKGMSVTGDLNYRHDTQKQTTLDARQTVDTVNGGFIDSVQRGVVHGNLDQVSGRAAFDRDLDKVTRISGEARLTLGWSDINTLDHVERRNGQGALIQVFNRSAANRQHRGNGEVSGTWRRKFAGGEDHNLVLNASYEITDAQRRRLAWTDILFPVLPLAFDFQRVDDDLGQLELKADYTRPMADNSKLKLGYLLEANDSETDSRQFRGPTAIALTPDLTQTNLFKLDQTLNQAYVTFERPIGDVTVLAGLRFEDVRQDLNQVTQGIKGDNDYTRLYPSLHLAWKASDVTQWTASYSHRIQRPVAQQLNPFRTQIDPLNFFAGNPALRPQETDSYELGWQYRKAPAFYLATLYYRDTRKGFTPVVRDLGGGVFLQTTENLSQLKSGGLELVATGRFTKTLTYNVSGNAFWQRLDASALGFTGHRSGTSVTVRGNLNWQVTPNDFVQLNGFAQGKQLFAQGYVKPTGMLNLGYRHKLNEKLSFVLTAQDVLGTFQSHQVLDTPILKAKLNREVDTRALFLGFTWNFGGGRARDPGFDFGGGGPPPT